MATPTKNDAGLAGPGAGYPQYAVVTGAGSAYKVEPVSNALSKAALETVSWPHEVIFFVSEAAAQTYVNQHGGGASIPGLNQAANAGATVLNAGTSAVSKSVGFLNFLKSPGSLTRLTEIVAGLVLVYIGVRAATSPGGTVGAAKSTKPLVTKAVTRLTPTGRAAATVTRHRTRVRKAQTRTAARSIRRTGAEPVKARKAAPAKKTASAGAKAGTKAVKKTEQPSQEELRRLLRARADQISTRVNPS